MKQEFKKERPINLIPSFKKPREAEKEIDFFKARFLSQPGRYSSSRKPIPAQMGQIEMKAIEFLYKLAEDKARSGGVKDKEYITALRMTTGLASNDKIKLYYEPVYVKATFISINPPKEFKGDVYPERSYGNTFYVYNANLEKMDKVNDNKQVTDAKNLYRSRIRIRKYELGNYVSFLDRTDYQGDCKSVLFSFQELFALYHANYKAEDPTWKYSEPIYLHNAAEPVLHRGSSKIRYKHTYLFSTEGVIRNKEALSVPVGEAANLAHLCPPRCREVTFFEV